MDPQAQFVASVLVGVALIASVIFLGVNYNARIGAESYKICVQKHSPLECKAAEKR